MMRLVSLAILLSLFVTIMLPKQKVEAWTASNLRYLCGGPFQEDGVYNYDFESQWPNSGNVDWPVNLVFTWSCDVDFVKSELWGNAPFWDAEMWNYCFDGTVPGQWHKNRGTKEAINPLAEDVVHMRPYAPYSGWDYSFFNMNWYSYCVGTTHYDNHPQPMWTGSSEEAEEWVCDILRYKSGWFVWDDYYYFENYEPYRIEQGTLIHCWENNGWTSEAIYFTWP